MDVIVEENRNLKQVLEKTGCETEDLREELETLKALDAESQDENEILKYKVKTLEAQAAIESNRDLSHLKIVDEL
jgi:hypothetical protein